ncbi:glutathione S-transferase family protein [Variovorax sp. GB1R11]|uniref:glutathione S-transferase family protein n=1 Tax=Variovorax sp. GB1R11 TaxID=3443741 RepID=UPI003F461B27
MTTSLIVHHLGRSQSERIVWLCEELDLDYALRRYERRQDNRMAPPEYKALHPAGSAPVITDGALVLAESGAIIDYLIANRGQGRLAVRPEQAGFADYLYWFHFANASLQPLILQVWFLERSDPSKENVALQRLQDRFGLLLSTLDQRLSASPFLAGATLTAADVMAVFSLTTMRLFKPYDLSPWPHILAYLQRIGARPAYRRAMGKADPDLKPVLGALP